jgi:DNA-binding MarR family transcriptional regulator
MRSYTTALGELQQKILKHIFECTSKLENANHIAKTLGLAQPTVFKSIQSLLQENYLESEQKAKRTQKTLTLTDKGAAAVVLLGVTFDEFENHYKGHQDMQTLQFIKRVFKTPKKRDFMLKKAMEYAFKNNYFDEGNTIRQLSEEELKKLRMNMAIEYINSLGPTSNIPGLKEFIDRYELDREFMKECLNNQKKFADILLKELDK